MAKSRLPFVVILLLLLAGILTVLSANNIGTLPPAVPIAARWLAILAIAAAVAPRRSLTLWIVVSMLVGIELGHDAPGVAMSLKVLSDAFLRLVKTIIAPLVFATLVVGIAGHADLKQVGRMGLKALVYFEVVTTFALFIGLAAINLTKAGVGISQAGVKEEALAAAPTQTAADIILHIFPENIAKSVAEGQVLQVVIFAILFAIGLALTPERPRRVMLEFCESLSEVMFKFTNVVMYFAPLGVGGAMAYTVAKMGFRAAGAAASGAAGPHSTAPFHRGRGRASEYCLRHHVVGSRAAPGHGSHGKHWGAAPHRGVCDAHRLFLQFGRNHVIPLPGGCVCGPGSRGTAHLRPAAADGVHPHAHQQRRGRRAPGFARHSAGYGGFLQPAGLAGIHHIRH